MIDGYLGGYYGSFVARWLAWLQTPKTCLKALVQIISVCWNKQVLHNNVLGMSYCSVREKNQMTKGSAQIIQRDRSPLSTLCVTRQKMQNESGDFHHATTVMWLLLAVSVIGLMHKNYLDLGNVGFTFSDISLVKGELLGASGLPDFCSWLPVDQIILTLATPTNFEAKIVAYFAAEELFPSGVEQN